MSANGALQLGVPELVLATNNPAKLRELRRLLEPFAWNVRGLAETRWAGALAEPGQTYTENALAKAAAVTTALGVTALADDSGIEVDALHGWPGPRSARWRGEGASDEDRMRALVAEVERRTPGDRRVRYVCVVALCRPAAEPVTAHGECFGTLVQPRGTGGFGYDPAFLSDDLGVTFGEAADPDKARVSHRARAIRRLAEAGVLDPAAASP